MAKAHSSPVETPGMPSSSKKPSQNVKSTGKQTTLFGFFSKRTTPAEQTPTPSQKRVDSRSSLPTPLPSSEVGDEASPIRAVKPRESRGLRTPVTPVPEKDGTEMDIDSGAESINSRKVWPFEAMLTFRNDALLITMKSQRMKKLSSTLPRNVHMI
jgi:hypothetical protein